MRALNRDAEGCDSLAASLPLVCRLYSPNDNGVSVYAQDSGSPQEFIASRIVPRPRV